MSQSTRLSAGARSVAVHDTHLVRRVLAAAGLVGIALVHLIDVPDKLEETPYVGVLFLLLIAASLVVTELLMRRADAVAWISGASLAAATILGFVASRTVGLPGGPADDIGNWSEPLGLVSLMIEAIVVWVCTAGYAATRAR